MYLTHSELDDSLILSILNPKLEYLELELQTDYLDTSNGLTCFQSFKLKCPLLKHLSLINIQQIEMAYLFCLIELASLETLILVNCFRLSNLLIDFVKECKTLKHLIISRSLKPEDVDKNELRRAANENQIKLQID